jgi:hypothetical protein
VSKCGNGSTARRPAVSASSRRPSNIRYKPSSPAFQTPHGLRVSASLISATASVERLAATRAQPYCRRALEAPIGIEAVVGKAIDHCDGSLPAFTNRS